LQHRKKQVVNHVISGFLSIYSLLMSYICCIPSPLRASKTFTLSFMVQVNHLGAASQGECIR